ncbi:hypothetical protein BJ165DRAFT_1533902 [Panaeolus papilionaceus]|nr:hypothetical protein BJ165DRAFT_1533902 [Panaeolus papilionaceus]
MVIFDFNAYRCSTLGKTTKEKKTMMMEYSASDMSGSDRDRYVYIRGLSYDLLQWLCHSHRVFLSRPSADNTTGPLSYDDLLEVIGMFLGNVVMYKDMAALHGVQGAPGCDVELMQNWITKSFTVNGLETSVVKGYRLYVTGESTAPSEASLPILSIPSFEKIETKTHDPYPLHTTAQLVDMGWSDAENDLERGITTSFGKCSM